MPSLYDLYETHTAVLQVKEGGETGYVMISSDIATITEAATNGNPATLRFPFSFDELLDVTGGTGLFEFRVDWDDDVLHGTEYGSYLRIVVRAYYPQAAGQIDLYFYAQIQGGSYQASSVRCQVDPGTTVILAIQIEQENSNQDTRFTYSYCELNQETGQIRPYSGTSDNFLIEDTYAVNCVSGLIKQYETVNWRGKIYEGDVSYVDVNLAVASWYDVPHRMFGCMDRDINYTYYDRVNTRWFLFPPYPIFEGCAYDRTEILNDVIDTLEDKVDIMDALVDTLTTDLATANAKILNLETELSSGGTVYDSIASLITTLTFGGTVYDWLESTKTTLFSGGVLYEWLAKIKIPFDLTSAKLTQLKNALEDPFNAVKTHVMRALYNIIHDWRAGT